jgi:hypothetical protein
MEIRTKELVHLALRKPVRIVSYADGRPVTVEAKMDGRGIVLYADGKEISLPVLECWHGRSPLFDPEAKDLKDWAFWLLQEEKE